MESIAAGAILESRDDLLRRIAALDRDKVLERIEMLRHKTRYTFAKRGRRTGVGSAEITCLISINGRKYPELIPEAYYWEFHLRALAAVSSQHRTGRTTFDVDYFSTLRRDLLQIPAADVVALLNHAAATIELIDRVRNTPLTSGQTGEGREAAAARVSAVSRLELMNRLSKASWMAIERHAKSRRGGITYDFRPDSSLGKFTSSVRFRTYHDFGTLPSRGTAMNRSNLLHMVVVMSCLIVPTEAAAALCNNDSWGARAAKIHSNGQGSYSVTWRPVGMRPSGRYGWVWLTPASRAQRSIVGRSRLPPQPFTISVAQRSAAEQAAGSWRSGR